ncbi:replication protein A 14 kDa subunit-like [Tubulanus polymorphus]|uniref:replication protein A 14 kDa subunit-like n=1 Tax=Tubulanus polymorphus TaxID=672921 RepID=UPI003DA42A06
MAGIHVGSKPRINGAMLGQNQGTVVCLLGIAHDPDNSGMSFKLKTCDDQIVTVKLQEPLQEYLQGLTEVHGEVQGREIKAQSYVVFPAEYSSSFDMKQYNKALNLIAQCPQYYKIASNES